jgi:RND family efflux transporter MFP subunit
MNKKNIILITAGIALVVLTVLKLKSNKEKATEKIYIHDAKAPILVETLKPTLHTFASAFNYLGSFEPFRQNLIGSDASGKLISLNVQEGDRVSQGQVIAKVDDEMLQIQLQNLEVSIEGQRNDDQRNEALSKDKAIPEIQLEKTKLGLKSTELQKQQLQKQLRSTSITAPFSGIITKKMVDLGSVIGPGSPLVEITDISSLKLTISVPERDILKFKTGQAVEVKADVHGDKMFVGKVSYISVQGDKSHNFKIQITVPNGKNELMAGMYGTASLTNSQSITSLSIPRKALVGSTKDPKVYVVRNGVAKLTSFNAGTADGEYIEVISGILPNDQIVIKGQVNIQDNTNVKISN